MHSAAAWRTAGSPHSPARRLRLRRPLPHRAAAGALAAVAIVTTSCSTASTNAQEPGPADASSVAGENGAGGGAVEPAAITGMHIISNSSESGSCRYAARFPAIPGADSLTEAMGNAVQADIDGFVGDGAGEGGCAGPDVPELNISFEILLASGDVAGVRLATVDYGAAGSGQSTHTYWYDGATRTAPANAELIGDNSLERLATLIKEQLVDREGADPALLDQVLATPADTADALHDVSFTTDGDLAIDFDRGAVAVPPAGAQHVEIPRAEASSLLSGLGRRIQQYTLDPSPRLDLGVTPTVDTMPTAKPEPKAVDCRRVKCIAMTFDDGPGPHTKRLLETLATHDAHATFFLVGHNVRTYRSLTRAELAAGHEVANHSWDHADLTRRTAAEVRSQISRSNDAITSASGTAPLLMRPPYGAVNDTVRREVKMPIILWSIDTEDWKHRDSTRVADYTIRRTRPGDIVLFHDIHASTVAAIPRILQTLAARGYHFVTVSQLYAGQRLQPGVTYSANEKAYGR
jgi:peptidoglycan/xylan/chitin deacetylase (PgdA/CDA1 family)